MTSLTIGQVAALIAAGTATLQVVLPILIPLVLIAVINKKGKSVTETAVTWSSLNRLLHSSWWPTILLSDSASSAGVTPAVVIATYLTVFATVLIAIAAVVTPLGLSDAIRPSQHNSVLFSYAQDTSPMGYGTLPRSDLGFSRICRSGTSHCPGSNSTFVPQQNFSTSMFAPDGYDVSIPLEIRKLWSSGLSGMARSVSRFSSEFSNRSAYLVGGYRQLQTILLSNSVQVYEGLIVDTVNGGIDFRNHSIPSTSTYGSTWSEDILFITPETECIDTNLTLDYQVEQEVLTSRLKQGKVLKITDHGGFADLDPTFEWWHLRNSQDDAQLGDRAYIAAWLNNALTMVYMNITNRKLRDSHLPFDSSEKGKIYVLEDGSSRNLTGNTMYRNKGGMIKMTSLGEYLPLLNSFATTRNPLYLSPHLISTENFTEAGHVCRGSVDASSPAHISNHAVSCGLFYPTPKPQGRQLHAFDFSKPNDTFAQPVHSCASASKATIKTVTFLYNGTNGLEDLQAVELKDKEYPNSSDKPLWGVEDSGLDLFDIAPFWGIFDPKFEKRPNISTVRQESLWLPGVGYLPFSETPYDPKMNIPGANFYSDTIAYIYEHLGSLLSSTTVHLLDYSGFTTFAMYRKCLELSETPQQSAKVLNLIWTDIVANAVVGTRGWTSQDAGHLRDVNNSDLANKDHVQVTLYQRSIRYRLIYAIPAMILLAVTLIILGTAILLLLLKRTGIKRMRWFLNQTSLGRNFTSLLYPEATSQQTSRKAWLQWDAQRLVTVTGKQPYAVNRDGLEMDNNGIVKSNQSEDASVSEQLATIEERYSSMK
ncbi:hypothetical protein BKA66DRAFT_600615 [Pyrenochaeta sp. MPI-SDFR-AT-0127]|nr:hypothetical protein BKA66DRAFT_600615 [Pyrenochaeta sp. MPI-SDFR-AT-0127]